MSSELIEEERKARKIVKKPIARPTPPTVERKDKQATYEGLIPLSPLYSRTFIIPSVPNTVDGVSLPRVDKMPPSTPLFQFSNVACVTFAKSLDLEVRNVKTVVSSISVVKLRFQCPINVSVKIFPSDVIRLLKPYEAHCLTPYFTLTQPPTLTVAKTYGECEMNVKPRPMEQATLIQEVLSQKEEMDVAEILRRQGVENLFELLFEWRDEEEKARFFNTMLWPRLMCVFLVPAPFQKQFPGELLIRKILATEYKRACKDIEAKHDSPSELSEKSKHVITFTPIEVDRYAEYAIKSQRAAQKEK